LDNQGTFGVYLDVSEIRRCIWEAVKKLAHPENEYLFPDSPCLEGDFCPGGWNLFRRQEGRRGEHYQSPKPNEGEFPVANHVNL
jgi:hypothetical protein